MWLVKKQYVFFIDTGSDSEHLTTDVPQGPLLFLIYINESEKSTFVFNIIMYADDTNLFYLNFIPQARSILFWTINWKIIAVG